MRGVLGMAGGGAIGWVIGGFHLSFPLAMCLCLVLASLWGVFVSRRFS